MSTGSLQTLNAEGRARNHYLCLFICAGLRVDSVEINVGMTSSPLKRLGEVRTTFGYDVREMVYIEVGTAGQTRKVFTVLRAEIHQWHVKAFHFRVPSSQKAQFNAKLHAVLDAHKTPTAALEINRVSAESKRETAKARRQANRDAIKKRNS